MNARSTPHTQTATEPATMISMRICITGRMGSGKSVLGRHLASRLGLPFLTLKKLIDFAASSGDVEAIDALNDNWRLAPDSLVERLLLKLCISGPSKGWVLEGAPLTGDQAAIIERYGNVIVLDCPRHVRIKRLRSGQRPLAHGLREEQEARLNEVAIRRASLIVDTQKLAIRDGDIVLNHLKKIHQGEIDPGTPIPELLGLS